MRIRLNKEELERVVETCTENIQSADNPKEEYYGCEFCPLHRDCPRYSIKMGVDVPDGEIRFANMFEIVKEKL